MNAPETKSVRTMCPMSCHPTFCGMLATVEDGKLVEIKGDKENPDSEGFLCVRGQAAHEIIDNPKRILHPLIRKQRGTDEWRQASWDEALGLIVERMQAVGRESIGVWPGHGAVANDFGTFANAFLMMRFANMYGCQWWDPSMICWGLGGFGVGLTGAMEVNTKEDMSAHSDLIVLWGANLASQPNTARHVAAAKRRGAHIVAIDVRVSEACNLADDYFIVRPGTDAALALAMMQVIIAEGLHDSVFIEDYTKGFDELQKHVVERTPEWAAQITGIDAVRIGAFARRYANTERGMLVISGSSMYKDQNGWQASRAISCLPALTGKLGIEGGGFGPRHAGNAHGFALNNILNMEARPPGDYVPNQMSEIANAFCDGRIKVLLLSGTDMLSSYADADRVAAGMASMDLVISHDLFMNDTARRVADVVLPGTAWLEDLGCKATNTHLYLTERALVPEGEARSICDLMRALAVRLDVEGFYPWDEEGGHINAVLDHPCTDHATVESLRAAGGIKALNISHVAHVDHQYATPSGKIEFYSERAADAGLPALPSYEPLPDSSHPLQLRMGRMLTHFHSFYDHGRALPSLAKLEKAPSLWMSTSDAETRGLKDGDSVRMYNASGQFEAVVEVGDKVPAGTVWIHDGWSGLNALTNGGPSLPDAATTLFPFSTGQSAYDASVEVQAL